MTRILIFFLMAAYAVCAMLRIGGHTIHILPVLAVGVFIYSLFTLKSAGVESESAE